MSFGIAFLDDRVGNANSDHRAKRVSAFGAALDAYTFLFRNFWQVLRLLFLPIIAAGIVLYVSLSRYLADLLLFLETHNPRVASLALGTLAAGLFLSLFCYAIAVSAISNLALAKTPRAGAGAFKATRQEWRVYAAYLRLLLLLSLFLILIGVFEAYVAPLVPLSEAPMRSVLDVFGIAGVVWFFARIGFLIAPVIATSEGPVLRRARRESARDLWRNCLLMVLLLVPGVLILVAGGYAFGIETGALRAAGTGSLADSARAMGDTLGAVVTVVSLSLFVTITLLTAGAMAAYQSKRFCRAIEGRTAPPEISPRLGHSVPAEGPPK